MSAKNTFLTFLLFPEYKLYTLKPKVKNKFERDALVVFAAAWVVLKVSIMSGLLLQFLTPYIQLKDFVLLIYAEVSMLTAITATFYAKIRREVCAKT